MINVLSVCAPAVKPLSNRAGNKQATKLGLKCSKDEDSKLPGKLHNILYTTICKITKKKEKNGISLQESCSHAFLRISHNYIIILPLGT